MFRCEGCGTAAAPGVKPVLRVLETRARTYPERYAEGGTGRWRVDNGGEGHETAREVRLCPACADSTDHETRGLVYQQDDHPQGAKLHQTPVDRERGSGVMQRREGASVRAVPVTASGPHWVAQTEERAVVLPAQTVPPVAAIARTATQWVRP